jgi:hypothetical protein
VSGHRLSETVFGPVDVEQDKSSIDTRWDHRDPQSRRGRMGVKGPLPETSGHVR